MFIRRTTTRSTADGERYATFRLVRSERAGGKVRQRTVLNLGAHFTIDPRHWPLLCTRLHQQLAGEQGELDLDVVPPDVEAEAQRLAAHVLAQQPTLEASGQATRDVQSVDIDSLELTRARSVGVEQLGLWAMAQVGLDTLLADCGLTGPQQAAATGSIIARMAAPGSERATYRWLRGTSALGELLDFDYTGLDDMALYRISDHLYKRRDRIESALFDRIRDLFGLAPVITLYDLTNTYFEGTAAGNAQAQRGHSKEKRSDCPLLTLGLVLDGSGFVRRSRVFAGNVSETRTLTAMLAGLDAPAGALVVMDRGIASQANLSWLAEAGYRYLVVSRQRRAFDFDQATPIQTAGNHRVHLQPVASDEGGQEVYLHCYSEQRAHKEKGIDRRFAERFEAELQRIHDGLARPHTTKRIDKIHERIGRLKEKGRGVGQHYHVEVVANERGDKAVAVRWQRLPVTGSRLTHPGVYCLRTNETDWDSERLWRTYVMLTDLEAVFRSLKSELGLRPIYHQKPERSAGHLFISVLAYQLVQVIRRHLQAHDIRDSWATVRDTLAPQCRVTATFRRADGRTLHVRKTTHAEPAQRRYYNALGIHTSPGGIRKMIV
jgi:transposase